MRQWLSGILLCFSASAFAQAGNPSSDPLKQSVSVSFATLTGDDILDGYHAGRPTTHDYANKGSGTAICIAYKYRIYNRVSIGFTFMAEQQHGDWLDNQVMDGNVFDLQTTVKGAFARTCYTAATDVTYDYFTHESLRLYLVGGIGYTDVLETTQYNTTFYNQGYNNGINNYGPMRADSKHLHLNGYIAPLGLRVGRQLSGFIEFGFGYGGALNTGIAYNF